MADNRQYQQAARASPGYGEGWSKDWHLTRQGDTRAG